MNDYSVFDNKYLDNVYPMDNILLSNDGITYIYEDDEIKQYNLLSQKYVFRRNTQINDMNNNNIYEYDLIEFEQINNNKHFIFTGIVILRRGRFVVKNITYAGDEIYDNKYELSLNDLISKYTNIRVIDNVLKLKEGQKYIRNKFYFKVVNKKNGEIIKDCHIDNNCNAYHIIDISDKKTYSLLKDCRILLSTDVYDVNGDIIYYKDKVSFNYKGIDYLGSIEYSNGLYYIDNIIDFTENNVDFKIPLYNKYIDERLTNITLYKGGSNI